MLKIFLTCLFFTFSAPALAIYKCESGDKISYSEAPCLSGKTTNLSSQITQPSAAETAQAQRTSAQEKIKVSKLENARHKREEKEEKQQAKEAHAYAAKQKKCAALALHKKWSSEDVATASSKQRQSAQRKAQRSAEKYTLECEK